MATDEHLIRQVRKLFEEKTGWGDSEQWSNQDFLQLSDMIREQTGVMISHVTLKRIWGKVKYESLPNTHTLNTLAQFLGYENWRDFSVKSAVMPSPNGTVVSVESVKSVKSVGTATVTPQRKEGRLRRVIWMVVPLAVILLVLLLLHGQQPAPQAQDYAFSTRKIVSSGVPNSVIFNYDATRSPDDSVVIQQSWDTTRRVKVSKSDHQYTSVYYYPDFYHATLQVHNKVVKSYNLLIKSNGWLPMVQEEPVPVYFRKEEVIKDGRMSLSTDQIREKNIQLQPKPPLVWFTNVGDFGEIYSDKFVFETALKNDYDEGSAACQLTRVYLLCEGTAIWVPLCAKGCVSTVDLFFTYFYTSGRRDDLSAFGVDFHDYVRLRVESDSGRAKIMVNDKLAYTVPWHIIRSKIIGIAYQFQGTGSVNYVSLTNGKVNFKDNF
jgi:hypothetical protein